MSKEIEEIKKAKEDAESRINDILNKFSSDNNLQKISVFVSSDSAYVNSSEQPILSRFKTRIIVEI